MSVAPFNRLLPGETEEDLRARQEPLIRYVIDKHVWPRRKAIELLASLDERGLAYLKVDMRTAQRRAARVEYDPFAEGWR